MGRDARFEFLATVTVNMVLPSERSDRNFRSATAQLKSQRTESVLPIPRSRGDIEGDMDENAKSQKMLRE